MTAIESRIASLENDMLVLVAAITQIMSTQTLFTSVAVQQLQALNDQMRKLRDSFNDGDDWKNA